MSDPSRPVGAPSRISSRVGHTTAYLPKFAATLNRAFASRIIESPGLTLAAAVVAFQQLDADTQLECVKQVRAQLLAETN